MPLPTGRQAFHLKIMFGVHHSIIPLFHYSKEFTHFAHLSAGVLTPLWLIVRAPSGVCRAVLGVPVPRNVVAEVEVNVIV